MGEVNGNLHHQICAELLLFPLLAFLLSFKLDQTTIFPSFLSGLKLLFTAIKRADS